MSVIDSPTTASVCQPQLRKDSRRSSRAPHRWHANPTEAAGGLAAAPIPDTAQAARGGSGGRHDQPPRALSEEPRQWRGGHDPPALRCRVEARGAGWGSLRRPLLPGESGTGCGLRCGG